MMHLSSLGSVSMFRASHAPQSCVLAREPSALPRRRKLAGGGDTASTLNLTLMFLSWIHVSSRIRIPTTIHPTHSYCRQSPLFAFLSHSKRPCLPGSDLMTVAHGLPSPASPTGSPMYHHHHCPLCEQTRGMLRIATPHTSCGMLQQRNSRQGRPRSPEVAPRSFKH